MPVRMLSEPSLDTVDNSGLSCLTATADRGACQSPSCRPLVGRAGLVTRRRASLPPPALAADSGHAAHSSARGTSACAAPPRAPPTPRTTGSTPMHSPSRLTPWAYLALRGLSKCSPTAGTHAAGSCCRPSVSTSCVYLIAAALFSLCTTAARTEGGRPGSNSPQLASNTSASTRVRLSASEARAKRYPICTTGDTKGVEAGVGSRAAHTRGTARIHVHKHKRCSDRGERRIQRSIAAVSQVRVDGS